MWYVMQVFEYLKAVVRCYFFEKKESSEDFLTDDVVNAWFLERRYVSDKVVESTLTTRGGKEYKLLENPKTRLTNLKDGCYHISTFRGKVLLGDDNGKAVATIQASRFSPKTPAFVHVGKSYGNHFSATTLQNSAEALKELVKDVDSNTPECIMVVTTHKGEI